MSRFRAQDGFTLAEMLVASMVGFVVLAATLGLLDSSLRLDNGVMAKTDAQQRGRLAMDRITQELRSQVCLNLTTPAIFPTVSTADSVTFYSDFGDDNTAPPMKRTITFDPTTGDISESKVKGKLDSGGATVFTDTPTNSVIFQNATRVKETDGTVRPFLKYYAYETVSGVLGTTQVLDPPLSAAAAARVARIEISFTARPTGAKDSKNATDIKDEISVRHADPNLTVPDPQCV